jgi:peroxiredoxin
MITVGQTAPNFKLFNSEKQEIELSSFNGKNVVILFYPQAFTSVCTTELCDTRDNLKVYES